MRFIKWVTLFLIIGVAIANHAASQGPTPGAAQTLSWSPDGTMVAGAGDHLLRIWNASTGITLLDFPMNTHVFDVSWSSDSNRIVSGSHDQYIRVWNVNDPLYTTGQLLTEFMPFPDRFELVTSVAWSPDGESIATGGVSNGYTLKIYDADSYALTNQIAAGWIEKIVWHPSEQTVAISGQNGGPRLVSLTTPLSNPNAIQPIGQQNVPTWAMVWNSDGSRIAVGYIDSTIYVWDSETNVQLVMMPAIDSYQITQLSWSSDDTRIVSAGDNVHVWNASNGELLATPSNVGLAAAFSPDGTHIVTGDYTAAVQIMPAPLLADLGGQITLPAPGTSTYPLQLAVKLVDPVSEAIVHTYTPTPNATGAFTIEGIIQGMYDVWLKHPMALAVMPQVDLNAASVPFDFGTLLMGDANNDNVIGLTDFSLLASSYGTSVGQPGYDDRADFNGDDMVTQVDFSILSSNYGEMGVPDPEPSSARIASLASGTVDLTLNPDINDVTVGQEFDITVQVEAGDQLVDGAAAILAFDPALLEVVSMTAGTSLPFELSSRYDNTAGQVRYAAGALEAIPSGTFDLVTVRFRALAVTASTGISFATDGATGVTYAGDSVLNATEPAGVTITN